MNHNWTYKKLGEVVSIKSGYTPNPIELASEGIIPYFKVAEMNLSRNEKYLLDTTQYVINPRLTFPKGAIVFPKNGAAVGTNKKRILANPSVVDLNTGIAIPKADIETTYLYYIFLNIDFRTITRRGAIPTLDISELKNIPIPLPPLETQSRIVAELDLLQAIIDKQKAQLAELDNLAQCIFYDMFGDPVENEKGFDVKELGEICNVVSGFAFPSGDFSDNNPIKAIKITNVGVGEFLLDNSSLPEKYRNLTAYMANTGDIAIALTRTIISTGLKRAIVSEEYNNSLVNQRVAILKCSSYVKTLIYCYLGTDYVKNYVLEHATALLQPNLSITDLRKMPIVFPPLTLQQEFAEKIEKIERQKTAISQSIAETQKLFDYTMDKYFE